MNEQKRNIVNGILGTIIFHLIFILIFLGIKLHGFKLKEDDNFLIDFIEEEQKLEDLQQELKQLIEEKGIPDLTPEQKSNIAVNVANKVNEEISTEKYLEELLKELNIDNLHPEHDNTLPEEEKPDQKNENEKLSEYSGETRIKYSLENRSKIYIPVPSFMCENRGLVVIDIIVDQQGMVQSASVSSKSNTTDECLINEALMAAKASFFNTNSKAEPKQAGYISFEFVAQ